MQYLIWTGLAGNMPSSLPRHECANAVIYMFAQEVEDVNKVKLGDKKNP